MSVAFQVLVTGVIEWHLLGGTFKNKLVRVRVRVRDGVGVEVGVGGERGRGVFSLPS